MSPIFGHANIVLLLIVHLLLGYRRLSDPRYYSDDPMVQRVLGVKRLPDVSTVTRSLADLDKESVCAISQTGQVLDVRHRPGNVHDSNGAMKFILVCIHEIRQILPCAVIEVRMDSAFFSDEIVAALEALGIHYTTSVPFDRLTELKRIVERRR